MSRRRAVDRRTKNEGPMRRLSGLAALLALVIVAGSAQAPFAARVVASGLASPWEIVWGPDGKLWVSERTARRVVRVDPASGAITPAVTIDDSYDPGTTWHEGLLGLAL